MATSSLSVLLVREKELDREAFRLLYEEHVHSVYRYVAYRLGRDNAQDVTADIFSKAWARRDSFHPDKGTAKAWLWAIARHVVIDQYRKSSATLVPLSDELAATNKVSTEVERREAWRHIHDALCQLDAVDQDIISLRFGSGETNRSIAAVLGLSEANVAQRLRRALRKMRVYLDEK